MGTKMFEENVTLSLKRNYSKDEGIAFLTKRVSDLQIENGKLKSDNAELEYKLKQRKFTKEELGDLKSKGWVQDILKDEYVQELQARITKLSQKTYDSKIHELKTELNRWREMYGALVTKLNK